MAWLCVQDKNILEEPEEGEVASRVEGDDGEVERGVGAEHHQQGRQQVLHQLTGPLPDKRSVGLLHFGRVRHLVNWMRILRPG